MKTRDAVTGQPRVRRECWWVLKVFFAMSFSSIPVLGSQDPNQDGTSNSWGQDCPKWKHQITPVLINQKRWQPSWESSGFWHLFSSPVLFPAFRGIKGKEWRKSLQVILLSVGSCVERISGKGGLHCKLKQGVCISSGLPLVSLACPGTIKRGPNYSVSQLFQECCT